MNTFVLILFPDHLFDAFDWIIFRQYIAWNIQIKYQLLGGSGNTAKHTLQSGIKLIYSSLVYFTSLRTKNSLQPFMPTANQVLPTVIFLKGYVLFGYCFLEHCLH